MDSKKIEINNSIEKIKNELKALDEDLAFAPQTANYYKIYKDNVNRLNEQLASLQREYDSLLTPEELLMKDSQLKAAQLQQKLDYEQKCKLELESMRLKREQQLREFNASQEEKCRMSSDFRERMKSTLHIESERYIESIQPNIGNRHFLESELSKLENWWYELTQFGQPCNAAYLSELYQSKKKILKDLITPL